jgi:hypothetical protein
MMSQCGEIKVGQIGPTRLDRKSLSALQQPEVDEYLSRHRNRSREEVRLEMRTR